MEEDDALFEEHVDVSQKAEPTNLNAHQKGQNKESGANSNNDVILMDHS